MPINTPTNTAQTPGTADPRVRLRTVAIKKLRLDFQPASLNEEIVRRYVARFFEGKPVEPVRVCFDGEAYYLAEGFHRVGAAKRAERRMILADVCWGTRSELAMARSAS
jgi:uncharacterized ParB-like nuclease family protein